MARKTIRYAKTELSTQDTFERLPRLSSLVDLKMRGIGKQRVPDFDGLDYLNYINRINFGETCDYQ